MNPPARYPSPDDYDESEPFEAHPVCTPADAYEKIELWPDESESAK